MTKVVRYSGDFATLPKDISVQLPASYQALQNFTAVQDTVTYSTDELGGYFHKYFPRSYTEAFAVTGQLIDHSSRLSDIFSSQSRLRILDIGSGIGGNMIGFLKSINERFSNLEVIEIDSVDGNERALAYQAALLSNLDFDFSVSFNPTIRLFSNQGVMDELNQLVPENSTYDVVMCSKFINEFYRKNHELTGLYHHFIQFGAARLAQNGILLMTELTDVLPHNGYFNIVFNRETQSYFDSSTSPLTQLFPLPCHLWRESCRDSHHCFIQQRYLDGKAKVFTQVFSHETLGENFYDIPFLHEKKQAPIRIKQTGYYGGHFCYHGQLCDTNELSSELMKKNDAK